MINVQINYHKFFLQRPLVSGGQHLQYVKFSFYIISVASSLIWHFHVSVAHQSNWQEMCWEATPPPYDTCQSGVSVPALSRRASSPPRGGAAPSLHTSSSALAPVASSALARDAVAVGGNRFTQQHLSCLHVRVCLCVRVRHVFLAFGWAEVLTNTCDVFHMQEKWLYNHSDLFLTDSNSRRTNRLPVCNVTIYRCHYYYYLRS